MCVFGFLFPLPAAFLFFTQGESIFRNVDGLVIFILSWRPDTFPSLSPEESAKTGKRLKIKPKKNWFCRIMVPATKLPPSSWTDEIWASGFGSKERKAAWRLKDLILFHGSFWSDSVTCGSLCDSNTSPGCQEDNM